MYFSKRFLIMLTIAFVWLVAVIAPIASFYNQIPFMHYLMQNGINAILILTPFAWLVLYFVIGRIQRSDDMSRLLRLEQLLRGLNDADLDQLRQRLTDDPDTELYESIEDLLAAQKRKNR